MAIEIVVRGVAFMIDDADAELTELTWHIHNASRAFEQRRFYLSTNPLRRQGNKSKKPILMHRLILERVLGIKLERNQYADHIDRDTTNNCRDNLRIATPTQNRANSLNNNKNGLRGVTVNHNRYMARIKVDKKIIYLGTFDTPQEAHAAYAEAARKYYGEFARWE